MPEPDRCGQILERNNDAGEAVRFGWVVRRTHFEDHLLLLAQIERLDMAAAAQVPDVHLMAIFAAEEQVGLKSVFDHIRRAPFACEKRVESKMPPEIILKKLRAAIQFPLTENVERFAIEHENAAWAVAIRRPKRAHVDAFWPAVNRVR